jgi:hypothetical protein
MLQIVAIEQALNELPNIVDDPAMRSFVGMELRSKLKHCKAIEEQALKAHSAAT